ncbi:hypothetical protein [Cupriavidus necator]
MTELGRLPAGAVLDGEACVLHDIGRADFDRLYGVIVPFVLKVAVINGRAACSKTLPFLPFA